MRRLFRAKCTGCVIAIFTAALVSCRQKLGIIGLAGGTDIQIRNGVVELRHTYATAPPITEDVWMRDPQYHGAIAPAPWPWELAFSTGHNQGYHGMAGGIVPAKRWHLRFPVWLPLLLFLLPGVITVVVRVITGLPRGGETDVVHGH